MHQKKILIVDDEPLALDILERSVKRIGSQAYGAPCAEKAREFFKEESFDLMLCDLYLPGESGLDLIKWVHANYPNVGVIMVSGEDDPQVAEQVLEMGAYGYVLKPFKINEIIINVSSALRRQQLEAKNSAKQEDLERLVAERTEELQEALTGVIQTTALTLESKDPYTAGHQRRVAGLASTLAKRLDCAQDQRKGLYLAGLIHDIGKVSIPVEILSKPTRLTETEFGLIKTHSPKGYEILKGIRFPWPIADIVLQHHERIDGSGYPQGLMGEEILLESRILAVSDVVEAMSSHRPYRPGLGIEKALEEIEKGKGKRYDPAVAGACLRLFQEDGFAFD